MVYPYKYWYIIQWWTEGAVPFAIGKTTFAIEFGALQGYELSFSTSQPFCSQSIGIGSYFSGMPKNIWGQPQYLVIDPSKWATTPVGTELGPYLAR